MKPHQITAALNSAALKLPEYPNDALDLLRTVPGRAAAQRRVFAAGYATAMIEASRFLSGKFDDLISRSQVLTILPLGKDALVRAVSTGEAPAVPPVATKRRTPGQKLAGSRKPAAKRKAKKRRAKHTQ